MVRNKARLVSYRHRQKEGIDYDEVFAPIARIEAIRIVLAFASYMGFIVYQMDVKSAFLYRKIDEEVYVSQPLAWYATLSTFLLNNGYRRGTIDKTLFIKKDKHDIILVQVYVDDIIFGSTKKSWCDEFEALMKSRFQMRLKGTCYRSSQGNKTLEGTHQEASEESQTCYYHTSQSLDEECLLEEKIGRKEVLEEIVDAKGVFSTDKEKVSTNRSKVSTDISKVSTNRSRVSTNKEEVSTDSPNEGTDDQTEGISATPTTQTPTLTTFGDDETIAQVL
ncbi:putative ribonuclease H-like domain-containing protein, partial [Tanacetum coccineum]